MERRRPPAALRALAEGLDGEVPPPMETVPSLAVPFLAGVAGEEGSVQGDRRSGRRRDRIDPRLWERRDMRFALAGHDIETVYGLVQKYGVSQRALAARTGQCQSEISEILTGGRRVVSYDVLLRIAFGLGVPRGWLGLGFDADTYALVREVEPRLIDPDWYGQA
jgi:hypothetical protein